MFRFLCLIFFYYSKEDIIKRLQGQLNIEYTVSANCMEMSFCGNGNFGQNRDATSLEGVILLEKCILCLLIVFLPS